MPSFAQFVWLHSYFSDGTTSGIHLLNLYIVLHVPGIHDPAGPHGAAWGSGIPKGGKNEAAQEARMVEAASRMDAKAHLSDQKHHNKSPGHISSINRENIENEIEGIEAEKRVYDSDEEYSHMSTVQKWLMEAKAKLYEFLKTGVEPL